MSKNTELVGIPDRTFWVPGGRPLVPEFKRPDGKGEPSPAQVWHMKKLRAMGYDSPLVESREQFLELMAAHTSLTYAGKNRKRDSQGRFA